MQLSFSILVAEASKIIKSCVYATGSGMFENPVHLYGLNSLYLYMRGCVRVDKAPKQEQPTRQFLLTVGIIHPASSLSSLFEIPDPLPSIDITAVVVSFYFVLLSQLINTT